MSFAGERGSTGARFSVIVAIREPMAKAGALTAFKVSESGSASGNLDETASADSIRRSIQVEPTAAQVSAKPVRNTF